MPIVCSSMGRLLRKPLTPPLQAFKNGGPFHQLTHCADGSLCRLWLPVILSVSDERKITQEQTIEEKFHDGADGRARRAADALWPLHHFRIQGPRAAGRSGCAGTRKSEKQDCSAGARALAMLDWRCTHIAALRLPRAAR